MTTGNGFSAMLAQIAAHPVDLDIYRRLHVKVSDIYHARQITLDESSRLRDVINRAFTDRRIQVLTAPNPVQPHH